MKPLIILLGVFIVAVFVLRIVKHKYNLRLAARIAMSAMLIFTAIGHFAFTKGMTKMLPDFIPFKIEVVYGTGVLEIAAAVGLLIPVFRVVTA